MILLALFMYAPRNEAAADAAPEGEDARTDAGGEDGGNSRLSTTTSLRLNMDEDAAPPPLSSSAGSTESGEVLVSASSADDDASAAENSVIVDALARFKPKKPSVDAGVASAMFQRQEMSNRERKGCRIATKPGPKLNATASIRSLGSQLYCVCLILSRFFSRSSSSGTEIEGSR